jgi:hypothetical protein
VQLDPFTTTCGACGAVITGGAMDAERMDRVRARLQQGIGDGYQLGEMLGRGGMGIVFQARELALDRDVALKVLAFDPILNPDAYARFEREAKLAARLDHPHIVPIFAVGQGNGIAFYTMRLVRGGSVESLVAGGRAVDTARAIEILDDVAGALDYAHAQGVVHRDIKPANVLIGDAGHAMVADFGIARAVTGPGGGNTSTGTGVVGSPAYMSPEQWRGERVDGRADQYALGVLAFELLTGVRPFRSDSMQELLRMHLAEDAPDIISVRHDLPSRLTDPIRRALAKDPADRFGSAAAFVADLATAMKGTPPRAAAPPVAGSAAPTVRTPVPPRQAAVPAAARAAKSAAGVEPAVRSGTPAAAAPVAAGESDEPARRSLVPWLVLLAVAGAGAAVIWKLAPDQRGGAPQAAAPVVTSDSLSELEKRFQAQIDEARRIAMAAERRADSIATASRQAATGPGGATPAPREEHAHVYVFAQGGTPEVVLDGQPQRQAAPALLQIAPGRHTLAVRGLQAFAPAETTIVLAPEDTQTVVFRAQRSTAGASGTAPRPGAAGGAAGTDAPNTGVAAAPPRSVITEPAPASPNAFIRVGPNGKPELNWPEITAKLGFDPRTVDARRLTPQQRVAYRRFQVMVDSLRKLSGAPATRRP